MPTFEKEETSLFSYYCTHKDYKPKNWKKCGGSTALTGQIVWAQLIAFLIKRAKTEEWSNVYRNW
jgi:hypothetical protein